MPHGEETPVDRPTRDTGPFRPPAALEYLGSGTQHHVFASPRWVVKVPRLTGLGLLARLLTPRRLLSHSARDLGGLVVPFLELGPVRFHAPPPASVRPATGSIKNFSARRAIVMPRIAASALLETRLGNADSAETARLLGLLEAHLTELHARGYYMIDFIQKNFVVRDEGVRILDLGLVVPVRWLREPTCRITSSRFTRGLLRDYEALARRKAAAADETGASTLLDASAAFARTMRELRKPTSVKPSSPGRPVEFPRELEAEARTTLMEGHRTP